MSPTAVPMISINAGVFYSREKKEGLFASIPPRAFVWVSAPALGTKEEVESWERQAEARNIDALAYISSMRFRRSSSPTSLASAT